MFAIAVSALAGAVFSVAPAWKAARFHPACALQRRETASPSGLSRDGSVARTLLVAEIAITLVLLDGSRSDAEKPARLVSVNPGFSPHNVITFEFSLDAYRYPQKASQAEFFNLLQRVQALPSVRSAALGKDLPMLQSIELRTDTS